MQALRLGFRIEPPEFYGSPKEVWGFRTEPVPGSLAAGARRFLAANTTLLQLDGVVDGLRVRKTLHSLGASHLVLEQLHHRMPIHRAYVTVHRGRDDRFYLVKNRAVPRRLLPERPRFELSAKEATLRAMRHVRGRTGRTRALGEAHALWYPVGRNLRPAYRVRVERIVTKGSRFRRLEWIVFVDGANRRILEKYDNLARTSRRRVVERTGRGRVFDPNPVIGAKRWQDLVRDGLAVLPPKSAYRTVSLPGLRGAQGYLSGARVTTAATRYRVRSPDARFMFHSDVRGFEEVMTYYHLDRAVRYVESLGYRDDLQIFDAPLRVDAARYDEDESWYSPGLGMLAFGMDGVDGGEDGETIVHEFGHALQDAICPDFGQSLQGAAMGEGFGDYLAASFFAARKPKAYRTFVMSWWNIEYSRGEYAYLRRVDRPRAHFRQYDGRLDEHDNGEIWSAALWDVREALGRRLADTLVIESHFQQDAFTTFARGARAIVDADANLHGGRHAAELHAIFAARGIGPM